METPVQSEIDGGPYGKTTVSTDSVITYRVKTFIVYILGTCHSINRCR
jgi:hypothetical protein